MTTRATGLVVVLEQAMRADDIEPLIAAIRQLRGVADVRMVESDPLAEDIAEMRVRRDVAGELEEMAQRVWDREGS